MTNLQNLNHKAQNAEQRGQKARKKDITEAADYSLHLTVVSMKRTALIPVLWLILYPILNQASSFIIARELKVLFVNLSAPLGM